MLAHVLRIPTGVLLRMVSLGIVVACLTTPDSLAMAKGHPPPLPPSGKAECPDAVVAGGAAIPHIVALVQAEVHRAFPLAQDYVITSVRSLQAEPATVRGDTSLRDIAAYYCGAQVADRSWAVTLYFPSLAKNTSAGDGLLYVAKTTSGWRIWYRPVES